MSDSSFRIVLATANPHKIREIRDILGGLGVGFLSLEDFPGLVLPPEAGEDFRKNALAKARFVAEKTSLAALADDSGLVVDALGGRPGVRSARYAGPGATDRENCLKLLDEMKGLPPERRSARFVCVLAYVEPGGLEKTFEGVLEGRIAGKPSGTGGFGYDPVFIASGMERTVAELGSEVKNSLSHRARALAAFRKWYIENRAKGLKGGL